MASPKLFGTKLPENTDEIIGVQKEPASSLKQVTGSYPCHTDGCSSGCHSTSCACSNQHNCREDAVVEAPTTSPRNGR